MKKLLFLFVLILMSCLSNDDDTQINTYTLSINNPCERIRIETISLPNHNLSVTSRRLELIEIKMENIIFSLH